MKVNQLLIVLLLTTLFSCRSKTAFDYSEAIVKMETELSADIAEADQKVKYYLEAKKTDSAVLMSRQMVSLAEQKLKQVQEMNVPDVEEGENFKKAAVNYFTYIRNIYSSFNRFTMAQTDKEKEAEGKRLARIINEKKQITGNMQEAQQKFASANDFRIEKLNAN